MMKKRKVLVTGAAGKIAGQLLKVFRERYELVLLDVRSETATGESIEGIEIEDLVAPDRDRYRHHFSGCDAVVHIGFVGNSDPKATPSVDQRFADEMANLQMAYNVYQSALEAGVRRVVVASSNHAADYYEPLILDGRMDVVDPDARALSDNYYGWAKEAYEHLGFVFAVGKQASPSSNNPESVDQAAVNQLENIHLRIGAPRETDILEGDPGDLVYMRRALGAYLSERDMQQLFIKSIEAPEIRDNHGVPFQIFYGISANSHAFWSIANAREIIGYEPADNSELRFADTIRRYIDAATNTQ